DHAWSEGFGERDQRAHVQVVVLVVRVLGRLQERSELYRTCIVDEDIDTAAKLAAEYCIHGLRQGFGPFDGTKVCLHSLSVTTRLGNLRHHLFCAAWARDIV